MTFTYFPGCTLRTTGVRLDQCGRKAAQALGFTLVEPDDWQCCGAVYPMARDEIATRLSSVRALMAARERGEPLVALCSACYHVIKRVNLDMQRDEEIRDKVNRSLKPEVPYCGETKVLHYLEVLRDVVGFEELKKHVVSPLTGRKIGAYYGCMLLRPSRELGLDDPENPTILEDLLRALGAQPVVYAMRNECCGGYATVDRPDYAAAQAKKVLENAAACGAEELVTACPLCLYNLRGAMPVTYFTELLTQALGLEVEGK